MTLGSDLTSSLPPARVGWEEDERDESVGGVEAFRAEFFERVGEAGGLKALALSWNGVARLEAAFLAWAGKVRRRRRKGSRPPAGAGLYRWARAELGFGGRR